MKLFLPLILFVGFVNILHSQQEDSISVDSSFTLLEVFSDKIEDSYKTPRLDADQLRRFAISTLAA